MSLPSVSRAGTALLIAGIATAVASVSPAVDELAHRSFAAHMGQHLILMIVAPLLLIAARPGRTLLPVLPPRAARAVVRNAAAVPPFAVVAVHGLAMWGWHAPLAFEAALRTPALHALEHLTLFATAVAFWAVLLRVAHRSAAAALYAFGTAAHSGLLAALIAFSPSPWYATYARADLPWRLTATTDQQLAGVLMWVPAGIAYMGAGIMLFVRWLQRAERRDAARAARYEDGAFSTAQPTNASRSSPRSSAM